MQFKVPENKLYNTTFKRYYIIIGKVSLREKIPVHRELKTGLEKSLTKSLG